MLKDLWGPLCECVCLYVCVCVCQAKDKFKKYANIPYSSLIFYLVLSGAVENYFRTFFNMHNLGLSSVYMWKQSAVYTCVCVWVGVLAQRQQKLPQTCMKCSSLIASNSNCKYFTILKCIHKFNIVFSFIENSSRNIWNAAAAAKIDFQYACIVQLSSQVLLNCLFIISAKFCIICGNIFVLLAILIFCGITVICTI